MEFTINNSGLKRIEQFCEKLSKTSVKIGVLNNPKQAKKAYRNEYGVVSANIPPRSNVQFPIEENIGYILDKVSFKEFKEEEIQKSAEEMGKAGVYCIQKAFDTKGYGTWRDNSPITIAIKGRNEPLVDTGELRKSYSYEVINEKAS